MEVENAPEVPEGEGSLFFYLLLSPDGTYFFGKQGSRVVLLCLRIEILACTP
jgi:hypothetical protein